MNIPGVQLSSTKPAATPVITVLGMAKAGKSTLATSLFDWPEAGCRPLVLAADLTGPDSCQRVGKPVSYLAIGKQPGSLWRDKLKYTVDLVVQHSRSGQFSTLVFDCASTMTSALYYEDIKINPNPDPRGAYKVVLDNALYAFRTLNELGIPIIWLSWLKPAMVMEEGSGKAKRKKMMLGGPDCIGSFKSHLVGNNVAVVAGLEKISVVAGTPGADSDNCKRLLHTSMWNGVECNSRYALPNPMPANLGLMLHLITTGGGGDAAPTEEPESALPPVPVEVGPAAPTQQRPS